MFRVVLILLAISLAAALPARASPRCQRDDPSLRPLPAGLIGPAERAFSLQHASVTLILRSTVVRCMGGKLWACNYGANLPCGRAKRATTLPAGADWCHQNPNAGFIPAYITGHDNLWQWRCRNGVPTATGAPQAVDRQGYLRRYWKILASDNPATPPG